MDSEYAAMLTIGWEVGLVIADCFGVPHIDSWIGYFDLYVHPAANGVIYGLA